MLKENPRIIVYSLIAGFISGIFHKPFMVSDGLFLDPPDLFVFTQEMADGMGVSNDNLQAIIGTLLFSTFGNIVLGLLYGIGLAFVIPRVMEWDLDDQPKNVGLGTLWGFIVWIGAVVLLGILGGQKPNPLDGFIARILFDLIGHLVFGAILGWVVYYLHSKSYLQSSAS